MRILIDIGHPAHVHLYKNLIFELKKRGHTVVTTVKDIAIAKQLLAHYGIEFINIGLKSDNLFSKAFNQLKYDLKIWKLVRKHKIEIGLGTSITNAHVSKLSKMRSVVFDDDDDEVQPLFVKYAHPHCNTLVSPDVLKGKRKRRSTLYYPGYHELAYLHPNRFKPDPAVLKEAGLNEGEVFFILRFNVFKAHHDGGIKGLSLEQKLELIKILKPLGKILITTERETEPELKEYQMKVRPENAHSLLSYATMLIGDSQTMTSEAAVLGVPSLRCNSFAGRISYLEEEEKKYGLTFAFLPDQFEALKIKLNELLSNPELKSSWKFKRDKLVADKIDVTSFMIWFIENYPNSEEEVRNNGQIFAKFK
jgi:predicted glycosyltransferase